MIVGLFPQSDEGDTTMTEGRSLTAREAVEGVLASEHADVLRESVALLVREMMELEVAQLAGAEHGERALCHDGIVQRGGPGRLLWRSGCRTGPAWHWFTGSAVICVAYREMGGVPSVGGNRLGSGRRGLFKPSTSPRVGTQAIRGRSGG
jgi:hypothetical protein